jgi:phage tail sheath protein FI
MAASYKTPGVYIEEISKFPPSVAEVDTAIPVFIGYTQQAIKNGNSLTNIPTKISSLLEYEQLFGVGFAPLEVKVVLDQNNNYALKSIEIDQDKRFYMYDSVHLFYDNGGNECYIVSVGQYTTAGSVNAVSIANMNTGLAAVEKEDEPTIILFPDACAFNTESDFYGLQQAALMQSAKLQDRVSVLDLYERKAVDINTPVANFRSYVGINNLSYGMAYTPWIYSSFNKVINYDQFHDSDTSVSHSHHGVFQADGTTKITNLATLTSDSGLNSLVTTLENALGDVALIKSKITTLITPAVSLDDAYKAKVNTLLTSSSDAEIKTNMLALFAFVKSIVLGVENAWDSSTYFKGALLTNDVKSYSASENLWRGAVKALLGVEKNATTLVLDAEASIDASYTFNTGSTWLGAAVATIGSNNADYTLAGTATKKDEVTLIAGDVTKAFNKLSAFVNTVLSAANNYASIAQDNLYNNHPIIGNIVNTIKKELNRIPPSGAVAGIYARVDAARGVWKAPANESINSVTGPVYAISNDEQANLNIDPVAGKSINAIRAFTGKGILVWGARTLAGNSNDYRYISVRRFLVMVEESSKNAAGGFVFEPNDANTWAKVQGMLENFLTLQWRAGALQGAKPSDAFFVSVGLNKTMSALDILEGRMIVEIGMAIVHPAEFIILRFSQLMAQS